MLFGLATLKGFYSAHTVLLFALLTEMFPGLELIDSFKIGALTAGKSLSLPVFYEFNWSDSFIDCNKDIDPPSFGWTLESPDCRDVLVYNMEGL